MLRRGVSGMNTEQISKRSATTDSSKLAKAISLEELAAVGTPSGTFADTTDIVIRIRNGNRSRRTRVARVAARTKIQ